ncbi:glycoside hydrolase family 61 protein [Schizophyllum commune]|nr:glycoside hydrolase family 61 protein [Schizophyllum commune Loenen D]
MQRSIFLSLVLAAFARAHGQIESVSAGTESKVAPNIYWDGDKANTDTPVRVMYKASSPAYLLPKDFSDNSKMACEGSSASPAPSSLEVAAGNSITVQWSGSTGELTNQPGVGSVPDGMQAWVHAMGSIQNYITSCNGKCADADVSNNGWTKLSGDGLDLSQSISDDLRNTMTNKPEKYYPEGAGLWAMAKFVADGSKWDVQIPAGLKAGEYIVRQELAAVHNPWSASDSSSGPQLYVGCIQVTVTGDGTTELPEGTQAGSLYDPEGDFAKFQVYSDADSFVLPGPDVWDGASSSSSSGSSGSASASSEAPATSTEASAPASTDAASSAATDAPATSAVDVPASSASASTSASGASSTGKCRRNKRMMPKRRHLARIAHGSSF